VSSHHGPHLYFCIYSFTSHLDRSFTGDYRVASSFFISERELLRLRIADNVVYRDLAGESVLLNLDTGTYFGLDAVGTRLWHLVAEHGSAELVIDTLMDEYDVDASRLHSDVRALIDQLLAKKLLTTDAEQTPSAR
jgi:hypothetical protein